MAGWALAALVAVGPSAAADERVVDINTLRALAPLPRPRAQGITPQPSHAAPRWSRRHSKEIVRDLDLGRHGFEVLPRSPPRSHPTQTGCVGQQDHGG